METRTFPLASVARGVAATAGALVLNVTAVEGVSWGYLTVFPANRSRSTMSTPNFGVLQPRTNETIVGCGPDDAISTFNGPTGAVHVFVEVAGWFEQP